MAKLEIYGKQASNYSADYFLTMAKLWKYEDKSRLI